MGTESSISGKEDKRAIFYEVLRKNLPNGSFINNRIERRLTEAELNGTTLIFKVDSNFSKMMCENNHPVFLNAAKFAGFSNFQLKIDESLKERDTGVTEEGEEAIQKPKAPFTINLEKQCEELLKTIDSNSRYLNQNPIAWPDLIIAACNKPGITTIEQVWDLYETPGKGYSGNVIFLSGESGAGKTTILESIATKVQDSVKETIGILKKLPVDKWKDPEFKSELEKLKRQAKFKLKYISAAAFSEEYSEVGAQIVQRSVFIAPYLDLDVLILDDTQYFDVLGRAPKSKAILIRIIEHITKKKGLIVVASRKKCEDLTSIGNDLRLAIGRGMRISMTNPDEEMKKTLFYNRIQGYEKTVDELSPGHRDTLMQIITRQSDLREVESIAESYKAQIKILEQTPSQAVTHIKKEFSSKEKQDLGKLITKIITRGTEMTHTNLPQFTTKREKFTLTVRESAIYLTYLLAVKEKGSKTNTFLREFWSYRTPGKINSTIRSFAEMARKGYIIKDSKIDPDNDIEEMLNAVYTMRREYLIEEKKMKQLGKLVLFKNLPTNPAPAEEKK
jgi:chromosomal replication initiation ATPase DnaA